MPVRLPAAPRRRSRPSKANRPRPPRWRLARRNTCSSKARTARSSRWRSLRQERPLPSKARRARGRIIQGFKKGGNDGINISVPEGTAVKAAENGVVAYAGNELKGYGNLVLIRHPNGFVSAY